MRAGEGPAAGSRRDVAWLALGAALLLAWDASGLDLPLSRLFGDAGGFAWQHSRTALLLHESGRLWCLAVLVLLAVHAVRPLALLPAMASRDRWTWLGLSLAGLAVVSLLKQHSHTSCPWTLTEFGGPVRFVPHWAWGLVDGGPGRCFPSGHASSGFALLAGHWMLRDTSPRWARGWLLMSLGAGALCGGVQLVRGAHFLSHSLWTAWICWALAVAGAAPWRLRSSCERG